MGALKLEQRIAILEDQVAQLKEKLSLNSPKPWWEQIAGSFANDPIFEEAMRLGRAYREAQRPGKRRRPKRRDASS